MSLTTNTGTYLTGEEAAQIIGITPGTFWNRRTKHGDKFIQARTDLLPHRVFYREADVKRVAHERGRKEINQ